MVSLKPERNAFEFLQSAQEESCSDKQYQRERNLRGNQCSCKPRSARSEPAPRSTLFQRRRQVHSRSAERGRQTEDETCDHSYQQCESQCNTVQPDVLKERNTGAL